MGFWPTKVLTFSRIGATRSIPGDVGDYQIFRVLRWETALDFACLGLVSPLCRVNLVVSYWLIETDLVVPSVFTIGPEPHLGVRASSAGTRFRTRHIAWGAPPPLTRPVGRPP